MSAATKTPRAVARPAAVLWDMDGTIVDTEPYWIECEYELVAEFGGEWDQEKAHSLGMELEAFQSNHEGGIIEKIHAAREAQIRGILINPGGYTHTSVAIRDALLGVDIPFVEIHISNVSAREPFRQKNLFSDIAAGTISGFGPYGYILGIEALHELLRGKNR